MLYLWICICLNKHANAFFSLLLLDFHQFIEFLLCFTVSQRYGSQTMGLMNAMWAYMTGQRGRRLSWLQEMFFLQLCVSNIIALTTIYFRNDSCFKKKYIRISKQNSWVEHWIYVEGFFKASRSNSMTKMEVTAQRQKKKKHNFFHSCEVLNFYMRFLKGKNCLVVCMSAKSIDFDLKTKFVNVF